MFARDGVPIYSTSAGWKNIEREEAMSVDTHVRIASMTKPITAVVAMTLIEEGKLGLDDPVSDYLPEFSNLRVATSHEPDANGVYPSEPAQVTMTVKHLLMFSSGIGPGLDETPSLVRHWDERGVYKQADGDLITRVGRLAQLPLFEEPGTRWRYGASADVLAAVIEKITGRRIGDVMRERVFAPLQMNNTRYLAVDEAADNLATVYTKNGEGDLVEAQLPQYVGWSPGGGGLVSSASDYMRFALMLWNEGQYQGVQILQPSTLQAMQQAHMPNGVLQSAGIDGMGWGLGMAVVVDADASLTPDRTGDFWWSGYLGTTFFVSPETGLVGIIMTQNKPSEFSQNPVEIFVVQALAFAGL